MPSRCSSTSEFDDPPRTADDYGISRYIASDNTISTNYGSIPDVDTAKDNRVRANPNIVPDYDRFDCHTLLSDGRQEGVELMIDVGDIAVLGNHHVVPDLYTFATDDYRVVPNG